MWTICLRFQLLREMAKSGTDKTKEYLRCQSAIQTSVSHLMCWRPSAEQCSGPMAVLMWDVHCMRACGTVASAGPVLCELCEMHTLRMRLAFLRFVQEAVVSQEAA